MYSFQKVRILAVCLSLCFTVLSACGNGKQKNEEPREEFPPITYEPVVEQNHILDGVFTAEPFEDDVEE